MTRDRDRFRVGTSIASPSIGRKGIRMRVKQLMKRSAQTGQYEGSLDGVARTMSEKELAMEGGEPRPPRSEPAFDEISRILGDLTMCLRCRI